DRQLSAEELSGGALAVSNLGKEGPDHFIAVINPPQAAVLAIGAARPQPAVHQGQLAVRKLIQATLSVDHRLADGAIAARFLQDLRRRLEQPHPPSEDQAGGSSSPASSFSRASGSIGLT